jgi:hypothetical protein
MGSDGVVYIQLFRKTLLISVFLDIAALPLSLVITPYFFMFAGGIICGWAAALLKLFFTFRGIYHITDENAELKKKITNSVLNAASYVLLGGILVVSALYKDAMLFGTAAGIFNVYFAVLIYSIYKAVWNGHR